MGFAWYLKFQDHLWGKSMCPAKRNTTKVCNKNITLYNTEKITYYVSKSTIKRVKTVLKIKGLSNQ